MAKRQREIAITRCERDGLFIYECEQFPGLYVADSVDRVAYDRLPGVVSTIIRLEQGIDCDVNHTRSYDQFRRQTNLTERAKNGVRNHTEELMGALQSDLEIVIQTKEGNSLVQ